MTIEDRAHSRDLAPAVKDLAAPQDSQGMHGRHEWAV